MLRHRPVPLAPEAVAASLAAYAAACATADTERAAERRMVRADARRDLRDTTTAVLLSDLADCRRDLAPTRADGRPRIPPPWWPLSAVRAGMIRRALHERKETAP